jgi:hypothetical protein
MLAQQQSRYQPHLLCLYLTAPSTTGNAGYAICGTFGSGATPPALRSTVSPAKIAGLTTPLAGPFDATCGVFLRVPDV